MIVFADFTTFGEDVLVPIVGIFCFIGLPVLAYVFLRLLKHRERMEMIRNGIAPGEAGGREKRGNGGAASFDRPSASAGAYGAEAAQTMLRKGITLSFIGFALTIGLSFIGYHSESPPVPGFPGLSSWEPGPWLLGGLIPLFVGLAQVVIALLSGATLRPAVRFEREVPQDGPTPVRDATTFDGSYTYRPGDTQELKPPRTPPERRP